MSRGPRFPDVAIALPGWIAELLPPAETRFADDEERMALVVELSRENLRQGTGGPFAAAVFDGSSGRLLAPGVNLVEPAGCSVAH
ncbi:MAG: nucleoside deaminase, partial [Acidobacteria bacterium]|nr:nucleoside deaminase [Acidobacteriota bacterium]